MIWPFTSSRGLSAFQHSTGARKSNAAVRRSFTALNSPESFARRFGRGVKRAFFICFALALIVGLIAGGVYIRHFIYKTSYFTLRAIRIHGASESLEAEARSWLKQRLSVPQNNLVLMNRSMLVAGLTRLPRAKQVRVNKIYPDTLQINFAEREPLVLTNLGKMYFMDNEGVLLSGATTREAAQSILPIVTGLRDANAAPGTRISNPRLAEVLEAIQFIKSSDPLLKEQLREWNVADHGEVTATLRSGTEVRFGIEPLLDLLPKLSAGLEQERSLRQAAYIDLRMEKQLVYKRDEANQP